MTAVWRTLRLEKDLWALVWLRSRWDFPGESGEWWLSVEAQLRSGHFHIVTVQQSVTSHYFSRATPMGWAFITLTKQWQKRKKKIETEASQGTWPKGCTVCFMSFASWSVWQTSNPQNYSKSLNCLVGVGTTDTAYARLWWSSQHYAVPEVEEGGNTESLLPFWWRNLRTHFFKCSDIWVFPW